MKTRTLLKKVSVLKKELCFRLCKAPPRKILFDHLPKCGGSTLKAFLGSHYPERLIYCTCGQKPMQSVEQFTTLNEEDRYRYSLITGHLARHLIDFVDPTCLRVTLLRDPIERVTSHYFYARRTPAHYLYTSIHTHKMTIKDYVSSDLSKELQNWYTAYFSGFASPRAVSNPDHSVSTAMDVLTRRYDVVGTLEDFSSFIQRLRGQANLSHPYRGKIHNATPCRPATASLPEATIQAIRQANELDLLLYRRVRDLTTRRGDHPGRQRVPGLWPSTDLPVAG